MIIKPEFYEICLKNHKGIAIINIYYGMWSPKGICSLQQWYIGSRKYGKKLIIF